MKVSDRKKVTGVGGDKSDISRLELREEGETLTVWQEELSKRLQKRFGDVSIMLATVEKGKNKGHQAVGIASAMKARIRAANLALAIAGARSNSLLLYSKEVRLVVARVRFRTIGPVAGLPPQTHTSDQGADEVCTPVEDIQSSDADAQWYTDEEYEPENRAVKRCNVDDVPQEEQADVTPPWKKSRLTRVGDVKPKAMSAIDESNASAKGRCRDDTSSPLKPTPKFKVRAPSNQSSLRALFEDIGLAADTIDHILNKEPDMTSIRNFVMCAETAEDAENWAKDLGLEGRVAPKCFVAAWRKGKESIATPTAAPSVERPSDSRHDMSATSCASSSVAPPKPSTVPAGKSPQPPGQPPPARLLFPAVGTKTELPLSEIWLSQDSIGDRFGDGRTLDFMIRELQTGAKTMEDIPIISVVFRNGCYYTKDNRRLHVFKEVFPENLRIPVILGEPDANFFRKLTCGRTVGVRKLPVGLAVPSPRMLRLADPSPRMLGRNPYF